MERKHELKISIPKKKSLETDDGEEDPKKLLERRSRMQVFQTKQLEVEEKERKRIEEEAQKTRMEVERARKKRKELEMLHEMEEYEESSGSGESLDEAALRRKKRNQRKSKKSLERERFKNLLKNRIEFFWGNSEAEEGYGYEWGEGGEFFDFDYYRRMLRCYGSTESFLSAISFEWEDRVYEFEELFDSGQIDGIAHKEVESDYQDGIGRVRYLAVCKKLGIAPITRFVENLECSEIDLSLQALNPNSICAISAALQVNTFVKKLVLNYNMLSPEDCHHLGLLLKNNDTLLELHLTGCRIGPEGVKKLIEFLPQNQTLQVLNLSKCNVEDEGMVAFSQALHANNSIRVLDLSYNKLGEESAAALSAAIQYNNRITDLNLRYNYFFTPAALKELCLALTVNECITNLNLSWNGMSGKDIGAYLGSYLKKNKTIKEIDLSDNRLHGSAIAEIKKGLSKSTSLEVLKLGKNPANARDLETLLAGAKACSTLNFLDLEELWVEKSFKRALEKIQTTRNLEVNLGGVFGDYEIKGPDYPAVLLKRAQYEAMKPKGKRLKKDFGHLIWTLGDEPLTINDFMEKVKKFKAKINAQLFPELIEQFVIPNKNLVDVVSMREKYLSLFPNSTPPPPRKVKAKDKKGRKMRELKEAISSKIQKVPTAKVAFQDEGRKQKSAPTLKSSREETEEEESEEEIEGEDVLTFKNLVIGPWFSSDEGELFNYFTEDSEDEENENKGVVDYFSAIDNALIKHLAGKAQNGPGIEYAW